jgi:hypothetical protein
LVRVGWFDPLFFTKENRMHRFPTTAGLALTALVALAGTQPASAQYYQVYSAPPPVFVNPAPVVSYSYYPPTTVYYPAPSVSYYAAPSVAYYAPSVSYYAPSTVTTRSYYGFGIFRPRGWYTQSYYTPGASGSFYFR